MSANNASSPKEGLLVLHCFGYPGKNGDEQGYYAVCIDVGIVTWRPTFVEARASMDDAIRGYLETVLETAKEGDDIRKLVYRPVAFFPYRLRYLSISVLVALLRGISDAVLFDNSVNVPDRASEMATA